MAFYHRMILELPDQNLTKICPPLCAKGCTITCRSICQEFCDQSYPPPNPPPPSIPPTISSHLYPSPPKPHKLSLFLSISLALFATTFFVFCCYTIYKYYTYRYSTPRRRSISSSSSSQPETEETHDAFLDEDHGPMLDHPIWYIRTIGLQQSIIDSITVCRYKRSDGLVEGTECSVCLNEFQEDETLRLLPKCNHAFHLPCIDTWLRSHTNCPMCRAGIVSVATTAASPSPEQSTAENSGVGEEIQEGNSDTNSGLVGEREDEDCELRITIDEEGELPVENGLSNEISKEREGFQPMRRSVSMDSLSASMISLAIANDLQAQSEGSSNTQLVKVSKSNAGIAPKRLDVNHSLLRLVGSSSIGKSLQKGSISMKRSVSCSGKVFLSRHSRSRNSVLPQ